MYTFIDVLNFYWYKGLCTLEKEVESLPCTTLMHLKMVGLSEVFNSLMSTGQNQKLSGGDLEAFSLPTLLCKENKNRMSRCNGCLQEYR